MRRITLLVCICLLVPFFILTGCGKAYPSSGSESSSEPITSYNSDISNPELDNTVSPSPIDTEDSLILVTSNGETSAPFVDGIYWGTTWTGKCWLAADGIPLIDTLPELANAIPTINYDGDLSVQYKEKVSFRWLSIFNDSFERIHHNVDLSYLYELSEGTYYIAIVVEEQGKYIETENEYESHGYECAYRLVVKQ